MAVTTTALVVVGAEVLSPRNARADGPRRWARVMAGECQWEVFEQLWLCLRRHAKAVELRRGASQLRDFLRQVCVADKVVDTRIVRKRGVQVRTRKFGTSQIGGYGDAGLLI